MFNPHPWPGTYSLSHRDSEQRLSPVALLSNGPDGRRHGYLINFSLPHTRGLSPLIMITSILSKHRRIDS